ncbi:GH36-type glycosyl hydrolase domain-containing protein [Bdellovibrio sp. HCB337]|uniref:GH36-type glycosyl hydrolase domain-containing protein n=1 Tax=Bdellovibrio sp. HCB337 TaxID=3394358 RepID=UPI0039A450C0
MNIESSFRTFEDPIRGESFSTPRLESNAEALARSHALLKDPRKGRALSHRINENRDVLEKAYQEVLEAVAAHRAITPAGEWLIDNFHIVRAQLKDAHDHLPPKFYKELPKLEEGPLQGYPRVYGIAWFYISHTDSHIDTDSLKRFLMAYQKAEVLTIGELWAVPITLRLVMMENLRRLAVRIVGSQRARKKADAIADEVLGLSPEAPRPTMDILAELEKTPFSIWLAVHLLQRLRFQDSKVEPILNWLDQRLEQDNLTADSAVTIEHANQTAANATVRNIITSSRLISAFNWREFFEDVSQVDAVLKRNSVYPSMDFATRDRYRHSLEHLAKYSPLTQVQVAEKLIAITESPKVAHDPRLSEPGYYLISKGRKSFEKEIRFRPRFSEILAKGYLESGTEIYLGSILFLTLLILSLPFLAVRSLGLSQIETFAYFALGLLPASEIAIAIVNRVTVALLGPQHLPRLDLEDGIPEKFKTFVVVPCFLTSNAATDQQLEQLEIHYLANPSGHVHFAMLTDWLDAKTETLPTDMPLLEYAVEKLRVLNKKYGPSLSGDPRFYIFHRKRLFNPKEEKWIAWERKRGKLHEFNELLLGRSDSSFISLSGGNLPIPSGVRYIITLDADTRMPKACVAQLVGTLAHPLNHAQYDSEIGRVTEGYGILQPRVTPTLPPLHEGTIYQRLSAGPGGVDPYATAVSDVYQDLFNEGSFTGKGIYDLPVFHKALSGRVPENSLLSHDLFEGNYARCGFLSDVEFFEDFPCHSGVAALRNHRWMRGDWQLLPWIFGRGGFSISVIGRWKMLDNLRRSLMAPGIFALFVLALTSPTPSIIAWSLLAVAALGIPVLLNFIFDLASKKRSVRWSEHFYFVGEDLVQGLEQTGMNLMLLPFHVWIAVDAIGRSLHRLFISHKNLLEWTTAAQAKAAANLHIRSFFLGMRGGLYLTIAAIILLAVSSPYSLILASVLFLGWLLSPLYAYWISHPLEEDTLRPMSLVDRETLHMTARRIWLFFERFVKAEDHFLPPDNFQEEPDHVIAHRSSPTNFGLYLLSVLAAKNFSWISLHDAIHRLAVTLKSLDELPKFNGHFFNWYETTTTHPLEPRYISSVDNGNLAGHLIAVAQGVRQMLSEKIELNHWPKGIQDSFALFKRYVNQQLQNKPTKTYDEEELLRSIHLFEKTLILSLGRIEEKSYWHELKESAHHMHEQARRIFKEPADYEILAWSHAVQTDVINISLDFHSLMSWIEYSWKDLPGTKRPEEHKSWTEIQQLLRQSVSLQDLPLFCETIIEKLTAFTNTYPLLSTGTLSYIEELHRRLETSITNAQLLIDRAHQAQALSYQLFQDMDFSLLFDKTRKLFSIGMRVSDNTLDPSYYDLLASEARLLSFIAIAKGDVPVSHWFHLGRSLTEVNGGAALVSWSGSMFEYLMPSLVMNTPDGGLIKRTCDLVIQRQIEYGEERSVPWGVSESAYNKRDLHLTYQYSNFGIPDLSLKRGQGTNLVVAPYATLLAAMYEPSLAASNLRRLETFGARGLYGFYEAIDFTSTRLPSHTSYSVVKAYMAHHQGMSLVAITNLFKENLFCRFFHAEPLVQATEILLQERPPRVVGVIPTTEAPHFAFVREEVSNVSRLYHSVNRPTPRTQILSNGQYSVMITAAGSGYSHYQKNAVTRWREDVTQDRWGHYFFLKDKDSQKVWSPTYQPLGTPADYYEVSFAEDRVTFMREEDDIYSRLEIFVSPESNAEMRQLTLTNHSDLVREIEVTSYAEIVLNTPGADTAHPAFSNLFVQTEFIPEIETLIAQRRPRSSTDPIFWAAHVLQADHHQVGDVEYETNRGLFLGRGRNIRNPEAIFDGQKLSKTLGPVLDPIFSLRTRIRLEPGSTSVITFSMMAGHTREEVLHLAESYHEPQIYERVSTLAWGQAQVKLQYLNIEPEEAHLFQRLASRLLYLDSSLRPSGAVLKRNVKDITQLWSQGISGDFPIIAVRIEDWEDRGVVRQLLKAQEYLSLKNVVVDLVILNAKGTSYSQELHSLLESLVHMGTVAAPPPLHQTRGKVFLLREDLLSTEERLAVYAEARVTLAAKQGSLSDLVNRMLHPTNPPAPATSVNRHKIAPLLKMPELEFFNGLGGFTPDGREYVVVLNKASQNTPTPWLNVISNGNFGFQVSESGSGYTWSMNSRENQITPWSNDPVCDPSGEAFYFYDHESKCIWSPTALPIRLEEASYIARHGQGYSTFEHLSHGVYSTLTQFVPLDLSVKVSLLKLENRSSQKRRISIYSYVEWVLGFARAVTAPLTITEVDEVTGALFALNSRSNEFGHRVAFASFLYSKKQSVTGDRREFIGRNSSLASPYAVVRGTGLSNHVGAALDPCGAFHIEVTMSPGETLEIPFVLGQAESREEARNILTVLRNQKPEEMLLQVTRQWDAWLEKIQVHTPDQAMNLLLNRWLLYQNMSCRYWARSAFYQAGGAYGFRDQLQDSMALVHMAPDEVRSHILRAACRQFVEGDVQHWWHPPMGRGVRTHFSDDLLWLPYVVSYYIDVTKDFSILEEEVSFLEGPPLRPDQEDSYYTPTVSTQTASLYEHCARALDRSLKVGVHGLPLIGCGDWNDGMNRVGKEGKGESVWLGWFLYTNLQLFVRHAESRDDSTRAIQWAHHTESLKKALETHGWDGDWYRRAYYDDGTPLGSAQSSECRIDSLAQTWAVISGAGDPARTRHAMQALDRLLVRRQEKIIQLFTPPFDKTPLDPGYIKGYLPGVRENGGQYTHAAAWCIIAFALLEDGHKAQELFNLVNPIYHGITLEAAQRYKIEPYVVAGDVYSQAPHAGRGGWSWYTGSAGWMYRAGLEYILGFGVKGDELTINPQISPDWAQFKINYRHKSSLYEILVENPGSYSNGVKSILVDGEEMKSGSSIHLVDDGRTHSIVVTLGGSRIRPSPREITY